MRIGLGKVAFDEAVFAFVFHHQRQMGGQRAAPGSGVGLRAEEDGEGVGLHGFDEDGAVGDLVEFGRVHWRPLLDALEAEAGLAQGVADGGDVGCAAGFQGNIDDGFAQAHAVVGAVVERFNDVGAFAGQDLGEVEEGAGVILQINAHAEKTAVFDQAALDDFGQQGDVDVAAADQDNGAAMAEVGFRLNDGGEGGRAGALGKGLLLLEKQRMALAISSSSTVTISST